MNGVYASADGVRMRSVDGRERRDLDIGVVTERSPATSASFTAARFPFTRFGFGHAMTVRTSPLTRILRLTAATTVIAGLAVGAAAAPASAAAVADASSWPLFVSELAPDNTSVDNYEYFEVTNTTTSSVDLAAYQFTYIFTNSGTSDSDKPLTLTEPSALLPAGASALLWVQYTSSSVNSFAFTDAQFRTAVGAATDVPVFHITGQAGMANTGERGVRIDAADDTTVSWSVYNRPAAMPDQGTHFGLPADPTSKAMRVVSEGAYTPGTVLPEQLAPPVTEPEGPHVPEQGEPPATDPDLDAPILQVTEVAPDTTNVGTADGYEFIELYNASDAPVHYADFTINYLYLDASHVVTNAAEWAASPNDPVIEPGRTLVLWIKNGQNDALTATDFNTHFGSSLALGVDLAEIRSGGMANGGLRGIQVATNTGYEISRADYMDDTQTIADQPIQYRWDAGTSQTLVGTGVATPGYAAPAQVPSGLVATPADITPPVIENLTGGSEAPEVEDGVALEFRITDDHPVRTVTLTLQTDIGDPIVRNLKFGAPDRYSYVIPDVDLYGKSWLDYSVTATDGSNIGAFGPERIQLADGEPADLELSGVDGDAVGGTARIVATTTGDPAEVGMTIDGTEVESLEPTLSDAPVFAFEATNTDAFFRNGVLLGDEVLTVFDEGFYDRTETVATEVPVDAVVKGDELTVSIWAGTKAWPELSVENNDDFAVRNVRLALPDGRVLTGDLVGLTGGYPGPGTDVAVDVDANTLIQMGDSSGKYDVLHATFTLPDDAFDSLAHLWDTTAVADGAHTVAAHAGELTVARELLVDNTAPTLTTGLVDGEQYRGDIVIDAEATDAGSGLADVTATLDGAVIDLPHSTSSVALTAGEHVVEFTAADQLGNESTRTVRFTTPDEQPDTALGSPEHGAELEVGDIDLTATPSDAEDDPLDVTFRRGYTYDPTDAAVRSYEGTTTSTSELDREERTLLDAAAVDALTGVDGVSADISSDTEFPFQLFTVDVPHGAGDDFTARVHWTGSANSNAKVLLSVLDVTAGTWQQVDQHVTGAEADAEFELGGLVEAADHVADGRITLLVQHSDGFTTVGQSERGDDVTPYTQHGVTDRNDYDFTIGWESDTQYYNETDAYYKHQTAINEFFVDQREELNLQYVTHTGDIVNVSTEQRQWQNADAAYDVLDEAGLPYGVLAGNHDVGHADEDYTEYGEWFGAERYQNNPWYGGSLQDNRGHYDLISADGIDFLMLSMGWGPGDEQIDWMNRIIAKYPERTVWINLHEYMLTTGGLGPIPQRILDEVVAPNPNVVFVSSGHYHDAFTRIDGFDDNGDGEADRQVYAMLFDYQGLEEGGLGYLRLLHFDNEGDRVIVRTYSPSLDDFDSDDPSLDLEHQEFEIPYAAVGLEPATKVLSADALTVDILTTDEIGSVANVPSGTEVTVTWPDVRAGEHGWYVDTEGPFGGRDRSVVREFTAVEGEFGAAPVPTVEGDVVEGETVTAMPGVWADGVALSLRWLIDGDTVGTDSELVIPADAGGASLVLEVTGTKSGYDPVVRQSDPVTIAESEFASAVPTITGKAKVGRTLTAEPGAWAEGVEFAYQWRADGEPIDGATESRLELKPRHLDARMTVAVTGTLGSRTATQVSERTEKVAKGTLESSKPTIKGKAKVGSKLEVRPGDWSAIANLEYRWYAGGERIAGATGTTLKLRGAQYGDRIRVEVTGSKKGYEPVTERSKKTDKVTR